MTSQDGPASGGSILGHPVQRKEDPGLVTGRRQYYGDLESTDAVYLVFVRSTVAHAEITELDIADALEMPGVVAVHTHETLTIDDDPAFPMVPSEMGRPHLARDRVRFVGEIIAVVVASSHAEAVDAAEIVYVDYETLPAVPDVRSAVADDAELLYPALGTNLVFETTKNWDDDVLAGSTTVVKELVISQRLAGVPMEPIGCTATMSGDELTMWVPSQTPIAIAPQLAGLIGIDESKLRVVAPAVGGGFGSRAGYYAEWGVVAKVALELGRDVRWTATRSEDMLMLNHGRGQEIEVELGIADDGTIVGLRGDCLADAGANGGLGAVLTTFTQLMMQGPYEMGSVAFRGRAAVTNTTRIAPYRGAGRPEATQAIERIMDIGAAAIGLDPAEFRRRNLIQPDQFPYVTATDAHYDVGEFERALDRALDESGYASLRTEQVARRSSGGSKQLGIGVSCYVEVTAPPGAHAEWGRVEVNPDGTATMAVGTSSHGQGHDTSFSMIVSDALGIPIDNVTLVQSDSAVVPQGVGTYGSRSLQTAGSALHESSQVVIAKAKALAAHLLEANEDDIVIADGGAHVAGVPATSMRWTELVEASNDADRRPTGMDSGLAHELVFEAGGPSFPFGSHVAVVEVDTDTGAVELIRHIAVDDCGRILNPMLVRGQQHGGIAQGIAQALFESVTYDEDANPMTSTLMDYLVPAASEFPSFECHNTETPSPRNPLGAKGIGESGTIGSTPAVQSAVIDALSHLGVTHIDMPLSPQRVWTAINS